MNKKVMAILLAISCSLAMTACGDKKTSDISANENNTVVSDSAIDTSDSAIDTSDSAIEETTDSGIEAEEPVAEEPAAKPETESKPADQNTTTSKPSTDNAVSETPAVENNDSSTTPAEPPKEETSSAPTKADAQSYIGKSLSSFTGKYGSPNSSDYSSSCMGDGEDGELKYSGFTIYTYRENGSEKIVDVG